MSPRDKDLIRFYRNGNSMRETAAKFDISLERVRQVLRKHAPQLIRRPYYTNNHSSGMYSSQRARVA